jgi:DNA repair protein RadC
VIERVGSRVEYHVMIRDMPTAERPRERLRDYGPTALSTAELLAIILRTGTNKESVLSLSARLLARHGGLAGLARISFPELCAEHGLGEAKAAQLKAALELGRRLITAQPQERALVRSPQDVANLLMPEMAFLEQEELRVVLLNTRNQVVSVGEVYRGSVNSAQVRVGEVLREAVRQNCPAMIVVHNHPSGDPAPSSDDVAVTRQIVEAGRLLDIDVLDHIVIGHQRFVSLREQGLGFGGKG